MAKKHQPPPSLPPPNGNGVATLAPDADPADPPGGVSWFYWPPSRTAGVRVTEHNALTVSAVWACVRAISETLAWLPLSVYRRRPAGGRDEQPDHAVSWMLHTQANPETTAFQFRETLIAHALTWGNGYAEIERDAAGRVVNLWQIAPDRVCVERDDRGRVVYEVRNPTGPDTVLPAEDVYHLRGLGYDGLVGYSVIRMAARSIGVAIAADEQASSLFANDSTPGGIIKHPRKLTDPGRQNLIQSWEKRHGGPTNRRRVALLEEGAEWQQTGLPPEDAQLLESRQFSPLEICRWFRVPPHKVAELSRATFSNIEEQGRDWVTDCLMPWAVRLEAEGDVKLFGRINRGVLYLRHTFNALMRGNVQARGDFYTKMLSAGVYDINEVRELEDMNPLPGPDGKKRFVPVNMQLLEKAGEELPPGSEPAPGNGKPAQPKTESAQDGGNLARLLEAHTPLLADTLTRCRGRATQRCADALKRFGDDRGRYEAWVGESLADHDRYAAAALTPVVRALATLADRLADDAAAALSTFLVSHLADLRRTFLAAPGNGLTYNPDAAADEAGRLARLVLSGEHSTEGQ